MVITAGQVADCTQLEPVLDGIEVPRATVLTPTRRFPVCTVGSERTGWERMGWWSVHRATASGEPPVFVPPGVCATLRPRFYALAWNAASNADEWLSAISRCL